MVFEKSTSKHWLCFKKLIVLVNLFLNFWSTYPLTWLLCGCRRGTGKCLRYYHVLCVQWRSDQHKALNSSRAYLFILLATSQGTFRGSYPMQALKITIGADRNYCSHACACHYGKITVVQCELCVGWLVLLLLIYHHQSRCQDPHYSSHKNSLAAVFATDMQKASLCL